MTFDFERLLHVYPGIDAGQPRGSRAGVSMVLGIEGGAESQHSDPVSIPQNEEGDKASDYSSERKLHRFPP